MLTVDLTTNDNNGILTALKCVAEFALNNSICSTLGSMFLDGGKRENVKRLQRCLTGLRLLRFMSCLSSGGGLCLYLNINTKHFKVLPESGTFSEN